MSKTKVGLEVDIDTSQAKKGLQELNKTEVKAPLHIDTKDAKKEIQELSKTKVEIDLNFDPKKVKKSVEGATGDAFKRYQPKSKATGGKMAVIAGGGGANSLTGLLAVGLGIWNSANQSVKSFEAQIVSATKALEQVQKDAVKLDKQMSALKASGKAYTGKTKTLTFESEDGKAFQTEEPEYTPQYLKLRDRRARLFVTKKQREAELQTLNTEYNLAKEARFSELKGIGGKVINFGKAQIGKLPGGELLLEGGKLIGQIGSLFNSALIGKAGLGAALGAGALAPLGLLAGAKAIGRPRVDEGRPAQDQIESIGASLGTISKNFTGSNDVSALTDQLMLLGVQGVNSVENLSAAASTLMLAFKGNQSVVSEWLPYIDDMAAATGMSAEQMASLIAQTAELGYVDSRLFTSLARQGIPIYEKLADVLGSTTEEAKKMAKQGKISALQFQEAFKSVAQTVKGTSEALSSMTLSGAEASFKASGELEHAIYAEGYSKERIEWFNEKTAEQLENAANEQIAIHAEALGRIVGKWDNTIDELGEIWDGFVDEVGFALVSILDFIPGLDFKSDTIYDNLNEHTNAGYKLLRETQNLDSNELYQEDLDMHVDALRKQWDELRKLYYIVEDEQKQLVVNLQNRIMERMHEIQSMSPGRTEWQDEHDRELERQRVNRKEWSQKKAEQDWKYAQKGLNRTGLEIAFNNLVRTEGYDSFAAAQNRLVELDNAYQTGVITDEEKTERDKILKLISKWDTAFSSFIERETKAREESAEAIKKETKAREAAVIEEKKQWAQLAQMFGDPNGTRELKELEMQERLSKMKHIDKPMKDYFMEQWIEEQETRDYRKYAIAMGKNKYKGEEMLQDEIDDINKLGYLTQSERDQMIEAARARLMEEMQSTTEEGTLLGVNTLTGEKIYGTADSMTPNNKGEYIHNAWGAACRVITQFDTNWDQKQYDELQKSTKANVETARGIQELNKKAIGPVVQ